MVDDRQAVVARFINFPVGEARAEAVRVVEAVEIFMEIVSIVSEMVHTDTVAVYRVKEDSPYLRLINALNEESAQEGKSWNLTAYPDIQASVIAGELYQGDVWKGEPAIVLPILYQGNCVDAILI